MRFPRPSTSFPHQGSPVHIPKPALYYGPRYKCLLVSSSPLSQIPGINSRVKMSSALLRSTHSCPSSLPRSIRSGSTSLSPGSPHPNTPAQISQDILPMRHNTPVSDCHRCTLMVLCNRPVPLQIRTMLRKRQDHFAAFSAEFSMLPEETKDSKAPPAAP